MCVSNIDFEYQFPLVDVRFAELVILQGYIVSIMIAIPVIN